MSDLFGNHIVGFPTRRLKCLDKGLMKFISVNVQLKPYLIFSLSLDKISLVDMVDFTDEEGYGKYLDLHECYDRFINLKGMDVSILSVCQTGYENMSEQYIAIFQF